MSTLQSFVLESIQRAGGLVEPASHGVYEVVLPDETAQQWHVPAYQQVAFDEAPDEQVTRLGYHHPLVEELIASVRSQVASTCVYITDLRLDKTGLADLARTTWRLLNGRVEAQRDATTARVRSTYILFNFKAALVSDEKHEQLVSVLIDVHSGHAAADPRRILQSVNADAPDATLKSVHHAPIRWGGADPTPPAEPLALPTLQALLPRAQTAVLRELDEPLQNLQRRARRFRELDEVRLQEYYDEMARDLRQRLATAQAERRAGLEDKLAAVATERAAKLADIAERYRVRVDLTLLNLMVIVQPKLVLPVKVANRTTTVRTVAVWDPLLHRLEPLVCTVCGEPSERTFLCHHGHFAHPECLAPSCVDCKRVFCQRCAEAVKTCSVCGRSVCRYSCLTCQHCGRITCQAHAQLCHADAGQPATLSVPEAAPAEPEPEAEVAPSPAPAPSPRPTPKKASRPPPRRQAVRARPTSHLPGGVPRPQRLEVIMEGHEPAAVAAYVLASRERQVAVRVWELTPEGITVWCRCEKGFACRETDMILAPAPAAGIEKQLLHAIDAFRQEYGIPPRKVHFNRRVAGRYAPQRRFALSGDWKDEAVLERAREGFRRL